MGIGHNGAVVRESHSEFTKNLTVWLIWVSKLAGIWSGGGEIINFKGVHISWSEFSCIDIRKNASSLVESSNESTAHIWLSISWFNTSINPSLNFRHSNNVLNSHVFASSSSSNVREFKPYSSKSLIQGLFNENVSHIGHEVAKNWENNWEEVRWHERRIVAFRSINPSEEEVVISIWETFMCEVEFNSCSFVELGTSIFTEWQPANVEISVLCPLDPLSVKSLLDTVIGPIPSILTFNDIEFPFDSASHHWMTWMGASTEHNKGI